MPTLSHLNPPSPHCQQCYPSAAEILLTLETPTQMSRAGSQVTCLWPWMAFGLLLGNTWTVVICTHSAYHFFRARVSSSSITVPTLGAKVNQQEDKRSKKRGTKYLLFWKLHHGERPLKPGAVRSLRFIDSLTESLWPLLLWHVSWKSWENPKDKLTI